jgi:hypothetical protein
MPRDGDDVMEHVDEDNYDFRWNCATQSTTPTQRRGECGDWRGLWVDDRCEASVGVG